MLLSAPQPRLFVIQFYKPVLSFLHISQSFYFLLCRFIRALQYDVNVNLLDPALQGAMAFAKPSVFQVSRCSPLLCIPTQKKYNRFSWKTGHKKCEETEQEPNSPLIYSGCRSAPSVLHLAPFGYSHWMRSEFGTVLDRWTRETSKVLQ